MYKDQSIPPVFCAETLRRMAAERFDPDGAAQVGRAIDIAVSVHFGQRRRSGGAVICHPLAVATILWELEAPKAPPGVIAAAVLHDTIEASRERLTNRYIDECLLWDAFPRPLHVVPMVLALTKPVLDTPDLSQQYNAIADAALVEGMGWAPLIRAADVRHNMGTVDGVGETNWAWRQGFIDKIWRHSLPWLQRIAGAVTPGLFGHYSRLLENIEQELDCHVRETAVAS